MFTNEREEKFWRFILGLKNICSLQTHAEI